ncbi:hypothetical protein ABZ585_26375, partial [Streptomyces vietnamensis]
NIYDRLAAPGNLDASPYADVIGRDRVGDLWLSRPLGGRPPAAPPLTPGGGTEQTDDAPGSRQSARASLPRLRTVCA